MVVMTVQHGGQHSKAWWSAQYRMVVSTVQHGGQHSTAWWSAQYSMVVSTQYLFGGNWALYKSNKNDSNNTSKQNGATLVDEANTEAFGHDTLEDQSTVCNFHMVVSTVPHGGQCSVCTVQHSCQHSTTW